MLNLRRLFAVIAISNVAVSAACAQALVDPPVVKVIKEPDYTVYLRYYDDENVEVYTRVYKQPTDDGIVITNAIHIPEEKPLDRGLMLEHIHKDKYVLSLSFNRTDAYHHTMDRFPGGQEAILVYRTKDRELVAVIGKKASGEWDTENNEELNSLIRKYHPEINK